MKEIKFRNLTKDEVEVRVGGGGSLLLYKTARVDANILDDTVGCFNWQKKFYQVKNTMICSVGININYDHPEKEQVWVWKDDAGDDDYTMEKVKAEASDSFKRAGFAWGIGRSLYNAPKIKLPDEFKGKQYFDVSELEYDDKNNITKIVITTDWGKTVVYQWQKGSYGNSAKPRTTTPKEDVLASATKDIGDTFVSEEPISSDTKAKINAITGKFGADKYTNFKAYMKQHFGVESIGELTEEQAQKLLKALGGK